MLLDIRRTKCVPPNHKWRQQNFTNKKSQMVSSTSERYPSITFATAVIGVIGCGDLIIFPSSTEEQGEPTFNMHNLIRTKKMMVCFNMVRAVALSRNYLEKLRFNSNLYFYFNSLR